MEFTFDIDLGKKFAREKVRKALPIVGWLVVGKAVENVHNTLKKHSDGNLANQIFPKVDEDELKVSIIANTPYARIQELGGDIKPINAKALAIPHRENTKGIAIPEGKSIRDIFPNLFFIPHKSLNSIGGLYSKVGNDKMELMYTLVAKTTIKGVHYLRRAIQENKPMILKAFGKN